MVVKTYRVNLDPADHRRAGVVAAKLGVTRSKLYRQIIREWLRKKRVK